MRNKGGAQREGRAIRSPFYSAIFFSKEINGLSVKHARPFLSGPVAKVVNGVAKSIVYSPTRTYGWSLLSTGLISLIIQFIRNYAFVSVSLSSFILSIAMALIAIPLLLVDSPMCIALQEFPVTDYLLHEFFSIKRMRRDESVRTLPWFVGVLFGSAVAALGYFFTIEAVLAVIAITVAVVIAFVSPEFPFLFMMLLLPYLSGTPYSTEILVSLSLISLLSFSRKVFLGKRVYAFGASDILILIFVLAIVAAGVIGGGKDSTAGALSLVAIAFVYIPAANIIVNRRLADCAVNSVVFSAAPVAIYAIVDYVITWVGGERQPTSSLMSTPEVLAAMLTATFLLALVSMRGMRHSVQKGIYVVFLVICAFALFATHCVPVLIVFAVSLIAYAIIANVSLPKELLIFPFCAPLLIFLLPPSLLATVSEGLGMSMTFGEMRGQMLSALELFRENLVLGIGANGFDVGEGYPYFNSPLGIACRFGAVAVGALAVLLLIRLRQASVYSLCLKNSSVRRTSNMTLLSLFALMTLGWFYDVFSDLSVYTLFLAVFGMSTAALRISRSEYDTRHELYDDQRNLSFSALDVSVSGRR